MASIRRVLGLASVLFILSACGGGSSSSGDPGAQTPPPSTQTYSVGTSITGSGSGSISPTSQTVSQGSTSSFTISPASDSTIAGVSGCGGSLSGSTYTTGAISSSCTITATFDLSAYTVTASAGTGGSISPGSVSVSHGNTTSFTVTPNSGYQIGSVSGCGGSLSGSTYATGPVTASCTVTASFESSNTSPPPSSYTVSTTVSGGGSGTISPGSVNVIPGGSASFNIFPDGDSVVAAVSGCDGTLSGNTYVTGVINSSCTVAVTFELRRYQVTTTSGQGGTIDPSLRLVAHGGIADFNVLPDEGFSIDQVTGCGGSLSGETFTTGPVTSDCSVEATFLINEYTVLATAGENGTISPNTATVDHGQTATFTVIPDIGYQVETIGGCGGALDGSAYATAPIVADCQVGVSFAPLTAVGQWAVKVLGRIDGYPEIYPVQLAEDGSALTGNAMRSVEIDGGGLVGSTKGFVWREDIGLQPLILPGDQESSVVSISADGTTVFGWSRPEVGGFQEGRGFVWRLGAGIQAIEIDGGSGVSVEGSSRDGSVAWGIYRNESGMIEHFLWTEVEGASPFTIEGAPAQAHSATPDGNVIVGLICEQYVGCRAMRWDRSTGVIDRFDSNIATGVSHDGQIVIGGSDSGFVWSEAGGFQDLLPDGSFNSQAREVSADGSAVLGEHAGPDYSKLFLWTAERGFEDLAIGDDQRSQYLFIGGGPGSRMPSMSNDGSRVVGRSDGEDSLGFIWISDIGITPIGETDEYSGWTHVNGISADGQRIVGWDGTGNPPRAFTWTLEGGLERLILHQSPVILSADGSTIAGLLCNGVTCEAALLVASP